MADYTVYYFPARGRAEPCRLVLAAAGANWEDVRKGGDDWQKIKPGNVYYDIHVFINFICPYRHLSHNHTTTTPILLSHINCS